MIRRLALVVVLSPVVATSALADSGRTNGLGVLVGIPTGDFDQVADAGWGIAGFFDIPLPKSPSVGVTGHLSWTDFQEPSNVTGGGVQQGQSFDIWEFTAGVNVKLAKLYIGAEGGYFTNVKEWALVPNAGLRLRRFDFGVRYKITGDVNYYSVRLGYMF